MGTAVARHYGTYYLNKYGILEEHRSKTEIGIKLTEIDKFDRIWECHPIGILRLKEDTTHLRISSQGDVERAGRWSFSLGHTEFIVGPEHAGKRFDEVVEVKQGAIIRTTLEGMQRKDATKIWVQELVIAKEETDGTI